MRNYQAMYYTGASISMLVGLWHFTVPWLFGWASYIPYVTLVVSINYLNLCFSFLLSGLSLILLLWGKKVFAKNKEAVVIYGFILLLWIFRVGLSMPTGIKCVDVLWAAWWLCYCDVSAACSVYSHCCGNAGK